MEPRCKKSLLFLAVALCIIFSVVLAENFAAVDIKHDCIGESCPICLHIETAKGFLKSLKAAGSVTFLSSHLVFTAKTPDNSGECDTHHYSPLALKVRFNS